MSKTTIIAEPGTQQIEIVREFAAPAALVFRAFTDPDLLPRWLGPRRMTMEIDRFEARDGGSWRYIHRDDAGNEYGFRGVFHGTPAVDGIIQTFEFEGWPGHVALESMTFEEHDGKTVIRQNSVYQSVADRDAMVESGMEAGLNDGFERLDELLAEMLVAR
jgi:uncharacterized protein YndB with AHSA1/START domain